MSNSALNHLFLKNYVYTNIKIDHPPLICISYTFHERKAAMWQFVFPLKNTVRTVLWQVGVGKT